MDDHLACSDLCEENGFTRQAELLRGISRQSLKAYVVIERGAEYNDEIMSPKNDGDPRWVYLDPDEAARAALEREIRWHRSNSILDFCYDLKDVTDLPADKLSGSIAAILGRDYQLPNGGSPTYASLEGPLIPGEVTDDQMRRIVDLFTLRFYYVVETEFASADRRAGDS